MPDPTAHDEATLTTAVRFAIVPENLIDDPNISHGALRLYAVLERHANTDDEAWPRRATLAKRLAVTEKTIDRWKDQLVAAGWIHVEHRFRDGEQISNRYTLRRDPRAYLVTPSMSKGSDTDVAPPATRMGLRGATQMSHRTRVSLNQSQS